jgi:hypothetical protein
VELNADRFPLGGFYRSGSIYSMEMFYRKKHFHEIYRTASISLIHGSGSIEHFHGIYPFHPSMEESQVGSGRIDTEEGGTFYLF